MKEVKNLFICFFLQIPLWVRFITDYENDYTVSLYPQKEKYSGQITECGDSKRVVVPQLQGVVAQNSVW